MKFFHTADWHLGKIVQGVHMTEDQQYVLEQFITAVEEEKPDAVIIAGDIYDRAVPPTEAVQLLDNVLKRIVLDLNTPVLAIAGNHDSPSRIHFGSQMMRENGLYMIGQFKSFAEPVVLTDEHGPVHFHLVPFADPSIVRKFFQDNTIKNYDDAMNAVVNHILDRAPEDGRHILIGHAFVTPYGEAANKTSDSELTLSIGGAEFVNAKHLQPFDYVALGHLHRAHNVLDEHIQYAGSILKYSISEEYHEKGFTVVEMDEKGVVTIERRNLIPRRDLRTVETSMDDLLTHEPNDDYVFVRLTDEMPIIHPMEKVRSVYPNALHLERKHPIMTTYSKDDSVEQQERTKMSDLQLFKHFYQEMTGDPLPETSKDVFVEVLDELLIEERE